VLAKNQVALRSIVNASKQEFFAVTIANVVTAKILMAQLIGKWS
jgi:hypothetical protein